jgi:hypothetical protein
LRFGLFDNASTDDTKEWWENLPEVFGVTFEAFHSDTDQGMAGGTNGSIQMLDNEFHLHLESDFIHLPESMTGVDKFWLHRAVSFMQDPHNKCDFLYLRRMENDHDMFMHFWSQWMPRLEGEGEYLRCPGFKWSNNPALFKTKVLHDHGTLPLRAEIDGAKGTANWTKAELSAPPPPNAFIHHWGMFMHEMMEPRYPEMMGCGKFPEVGSSTCKYGFYKDGIDRFCQACDLKKGREDMPAHEQRMRQIFRGQNDKISMGTVVLKEKAFEAHLKPSLAGCNENDLVDVMVIDAEDGVGLATIYNRLIDQAKGRFLIFAHPDVTFSPDLITNVRQQLSMDHVGVVGATGPNDTGKVFWSGSIKRPQKVSSLDGCFFAIDREKGLRFDEKTFDEFHLYAEDLCFDARDKGLKVYVIPAKEFYHESETLKERGTCWGRYQEYKQRLIQKWHKKFKVITT